MLRASWRVGGRFGGIPPMPCAVVLVVGAAALVLDDRLSGLGLAGGAQP